MKTSGGNLFCSKEASILLDGEAVGVAISGERNEGFVASTSGTIWFTELGDRTTIKINANHLSDAAVENFDFKYVSP